MAKRSHTPARAAQPLQPALPEMHSSVVPADSIAGRALLVVVAIMTLLTCLTTGAVILVRASAAQWQSEIAREVTIQIRPAAGRNLDAETQKAAELARTFPGVSEVRPYSKEESARLLEPWLGSGLSLSDLPVPRVIAMRIAPGATPDFPALRRTLTERVAGATLDDHRGWTDRMRVMTNTIVFGGIAILLLMLAATILSVTFATRGAIATNRPVIEVLHLIGAKDAYIAKQFQRHFLLLGIKGGLVGGGAAVLLFAFAGVVADWFVGTAGVDQISALFGTFSLGLAGYFALLLQVVLIAGLTAATCRHTVRQTLETV